MQASGRVELIKDELDNWRKRRVCTQDGRKQVVDILLQRTLYNHTTVCYKIRLGFLTKIFTQQNKTW